MNEKPLERKTYGSIAHLPGSRLTEDDDKYGNPGLVRIATEKERDRHDTVIVMEKMDGSNAGVAMIDGGITPLTRGGLRADKSRFAQHRMFAEWVWMHDDVFRVILNEGELLVGEWLALAHGTLYDLTDRSPYPVFDLFRPHTAQQKEKNKGATRYPTAELERRIINTPLVHAPIVHRGAALDIKRAVQRVGRKGWYGATSKVEGVVYRVERNEEPDFLLKWVNPYFQPGMFLPGIEGNEDGTEIWNWRHDW